MSSVRTTMSHLRRALRRLRSLVRDEDHDPWLDEHVKEHDKPTNIAGPSAQGGG